MKALVVLGPLGSGKTTTLIRLLAQMDRRNNVRLVINEVGRFAIDIDRIAAATGNVLDIDSLTAGCLGCANLAEFDQIIGQCSQQDGLLLIEPTGVADGHEIKAALARHHVPWRCLTLVNPVTFVHDQRAGILPTQLDVATHVAVTRTDSVSDELLVRLAPYGVPVVSLPRETLGGLSIERLLEGGGHHHGYHHKHACDGHHECGHHHHDHDHHHGHGHGYETTPILLRSSVTAEELARVLDALDLRRAKGVVNGYWFDRVGSEFTLGDTRDELPYAILIADAPLDARLVATISQPSAHDERSLKERLSQLSREEAHAEIDRLLAQAGEVVDASGALRLSDESVDHACEIAKAPSVAMEYRQAAKQARIRHALAVYDLLDQATAPGNALIEVGAVLAWQCAKRAEEVGDELVREVQRRKPATMWLAGLARIDDPRYDLVPEGYGGPLSPEAGGVIVAWGQVHEGLSAHVIANALRVMAVRAAAYGTWSDRWYRALESLGVQV